MLQKGAPKRMLCQREVRELRELTLEKIRLRRAAPPHTVLGELCAGEFLVELHWSCHMQMAASSVSKATLAKLKKQFDQVRDSQMKPVTSTPDGSTLDLRGRTWLVPPGEWQRLHMETE